ncbi:hypothetical protein HDE_01100 [Halotydeus destructor]|nr:hypothetical protein HDE_01100 [Halotydeus destructor]
MNGSARVNGGAGGGDRSYNGGLIPIDGPLSRASSNGSRDESDGSGLSTKMASMAIRKSPKPKDLKQFLIKKMAPPEYKIPFCLDSMALRDRFEGILTRVLENVNGKLECIIMGDAPSYVELNTHLAAACEKAQPATKPYRVGELVAARSMSDNDWCRAFVHTILGGNQYIVVYIDSGYAEMVDTIVPLPEAFGENPIIAGYAVAETTYNTKIDVEEPTDFVAIIAERNVEHTKVRAVILNEKVTLKVYPLSFVNIKRFPAVSEVDISGNSSPVEDELNEYAAKEAEMKKQREKRADEERQKLLREAEKKRLAQEAQRSVEEAKQAEIRKQLEEAKAKLEEERKSQEAKKRAEEAAVAAKVEEANRAAHQKKLVAEREAREAKAREEEKARLEVERKSAQEAIERSKQVEEVKPIAEAKKVAETNGSSSTKVKPKAPFPQVTITVDNPLTGPVVWVEKPFFFLSADATASDAMMATLTTYEVARTEIKKGQICAAKASDNAFYRAFVLATDDDKSKVYFVDYGNEEVVSNKNIGSLPATVSLTAQPALAIKCKCPDDDKNGMSAVNLAFDTFNVVTVLPTMQVDDYYVVDVVA